MAGVTKAEKILLIKHLGVAKARKMGITFAQVCLFSRSPLLSFLHGLLAFLNFFFFILLHFFRDTFFMRELVHVFCLCSICLMYFYEPLCLSVLYITLLTSALFNDLFLTTIIAVKC